MSKGSKLLIKAFLVVSTAFFAGKLIVASQGFLSPLVSAVILALIVLPLARKMEKGFINRGFSSFISTLLLFIFSLLFLSLCSMQLKSFFSDWPAIQETMAPEIEKFKSFLFEHTLLDKDKLQAYYPSGSIPLLDEQSNTGAKALSFVKSSLNFMGAFLLTFIYIFFLLFYRSHFKKFLLRLVNSEKRNKVSRVIEEAAEKVQEYLIGRLILMAILAVLYAIGLGFSGVDNYILVGVIASLLTLIPWIGNIIGFAMAMAFGYLTSGNIDVLWGIVITFTVSQFFESYVLQPYIVGDKVGLHPFFVILFVMLGGALWGLMGMVLAIPIIAMITVVLQNVDALKPYGFLFSKNKE